MHQRTIAARQKLLELIQNGRFPAYSFLPSERKLCAELSVGRGAIRVIRRELYDLGVLRYSAEHRRHQIMNMKEPRLKRLLVLLDSFNQNPHEALQILEGIQEKAAEIGAQVLLNFFNQVKYDSASLLGRYQAQEFQGILHLERYEPQVQEELLAAGLPSLVANNERAEPCAGISINYRAVGRLAGRHLVEAGHREIAMLGGKRSQHIYTEMLAGLKGALAEDDIALQKSRILLIEKPDALFTELGQLLSNNSRPTAIFTGRDHWAAAVYSCCREMKLDIPRQLSIISYDGVSWPQAEGIGLSSILEPTREIGRQSVELLQNWVEKTSAERSRVLSVKLCKRNSVKKIEQ